LGEPFLARFHGAVSRLDDIVLALTPKAIRSVLQERLAAGKSQR
jgi:hypothetical protein